MSRLAAFEPRRAAYFSICLPARSISLPTLYKKGGGGNRKENTRLNETQRLDPLPAPPPYSTGANLLIDPIPPVTNITARTAGDPFPGRKAVILETQASRGFHLDQ
jgi:hypothetical protein